MAEKRWQDQASDRPFLSTAACAEVDGSVKLGA
jgi:hypothetical protein